MSNTMFLSRSENKMAVKISNGVKSFKERFSFSKTSNNVDVLQNLNLNVPAGSLYSLLGSSGCGKTTVISIIMGLCKLDAGALYVLASPRVPGYMPQETCLYLEFSIYETLQYFGTLFGIYGHEFLISRIHDLRNLLQLPSEEQIVGTLSGGQKRRLSLAVALIHEPDILLLDGPTTGVDPLARELIWDYLFELTKTKGTTIILTTHYVDEAKHSNIVGFMRNGQLIAENTPSSLFETYKVNSMESVFLALCQEQNIPSITYPSTTNITDSRLDQLNNVGVTQRENVYNSLKRIYTLAGKNYKVTYRNIGMLFLITTIPAMCLLGTCLGMQDDPQGISLGIVNYELDGGINDCPTNTNLNDYCRLEQLSCVFLENLIGNTIQMINFPTVESAIQAVEHGNIYGYIYFSKNYTSAVVNRVLMGSSSSYYDESEEGKSEWNDSKITVRLDKTSTVVYWKVMETLHQAFENSSKLIQKNCGYDERLAEFPLQYSDPIIGDNKMTLLNYVGPSIAIELIYLFSLTTAIRFISEKRDGTLERCLAGGCRNFEILISYSIAQFSVILIQSILLIVVLYFGFSLVSDLSKLPCILGLFCLQGLSGLAVGLLLAIFCTEEAQAAIAILAIVLPNFFVSGLLWPLEGLPEVMQKISPYLPMTLAGESMRSLMIRGWEFSQENVWQGFLVTLGYLIFWSVLVIMLISKQLRK